MRYICPNCEAEIAASVVACISCGSSVSKGDGWRPVPFPEAVRAPVARPAPSATGPNRILLVEPYEYPGDLIVTKTGEFVTGGSYFLDYSRPLQRIKALGIGPTSWLIVPVVHEAQDKGEFVISVGRADPYFQNIETFWKKRHPTRWVRRSIGPDLLEIIGHFALQFPEDAQEPRQ